MDAFPKGMERLMDIIEVIERKPHWDNQKANPVRNPNFRKNQNQNTSKNGPNQNIRTPFQGKYAETSHQEDPEIDT